MLAPILKALSLVDSAHHGAGSSLASPTISSTDSLQGLLFHCSMPRWDNPLPSTVSEMSFRMVDLHLTRSSIHSYPLQSTTDSAIHKPKNCRHAHFDTSRLAGAVVLKRSQPSAHPFEPSVPCIRVITRTFLYARLLPLAAAVFHPSSYNEAQLNGRFEHRLPKPPAQ